MFAAVGKFLKDLLCEDDENKIYCPVRVIGASGLVTLILATAFMVVTKGTFDPMGFGAGIAGIAGSTGAGAGVKAKMGG
jgi:hypothetical protein